MAIYVLQIRSANHWGRPTKIDLIGPFRNEFSDMTISPPAITVGSRDNKVAESNARRWMSHPYHDQRGVLRSIVVELDELDQLNVAVKAPRAIW